jgi:hypothetical protein
MGLPQLAVLKHSLHRFGLPQSCARMGLSWGYANPLALAQSPRGRGRQYRRGESRAAQDASR